jgi:hypothetical protein
MALFKRTRALAQLLVLLALAIPMVEARAWQAQKAEEVNLAVPDDWRPISGFLPGEAAWYLGEPGPKARVWVQVARKKSVDDFLSLIVVEEEKAVSLGGKPARLYRGHSLDQAQKAVLVIAADADSQGRRVGLVFGGQELFSFTKERDQIISSVAFNQEASLPASAFSSPPAPPAPPAEPVAAQPAPVQLTAQATPAVTPAPEAPPAADKATGSPAAQEAPPVEDWTAATPAVPETSPAMEKATAPPAAPETSPAMEKVTAPPAAPETSPAMEKATAPPAVPETSPAREKVTAPPAAPETSPATEAATAPPVAQEISPATEKATAPPAAPAGQPAAKPSEPETRAWLVNIKGSGDYVGRGEALKGDGSPDVHIRLSIFAPGKTISSFSLMSTSGQAAAWDTLPGNDIWLMAVKRGNELLNKPDGSVSIAMQAQGDLFDLWLQDNNAFAGGKTGFTLTVAFVDGDSLSLPLRMKNLR